ncbi:hypothetical protein LOK49_LG12G00418 [Camellia lanceoleosa]|uniref:Uncharacterized protein n=1 Tax=Camellia lanceoleosa TaxID=1840588 RepID=A0ACC0FTG7_9ERIC|nr:hypothetical protein LOK49_LG12G00418 [Camellia lanceoleosa]
MAVPVCNSSNPLFPSSIILLCSLFFMHYYFPLHATALSFNFTNIDDQGIEVTPNDDMVQSGAAAGKAGRATYKKTFYLWDEASGNVTDFDTYFVFVITQYDKNVAPADGLTFFLLPYDNATSNITTATPKVPVVFVVDLKKHLPSKVTIGFSASTGSNFERNNVKSLTFNSTLQIDEPTQPSASPSSNTVTPSPGKKIGENNKNALIVELTASQFVLVGGLALLGFALWKKSGRAKQEAEFSIELSMDNDFEAATLPILLAKMPVPTYLAPPMNAASLVYGSTIVSNSNQFQSSSYSYNTNCSKFTSSSATSSPSASLLYT